jgi:hypothetical protein
MRKPDGNAQAGWYDHPSKPNLFQYWNGKYWTDDVRSPDQELPSTIPNKPVRSFPESITHTVLNTFNYRGRAGRREYWLFQAVYLSLAFILSNVFTSGGLQVIAGVFIWVFIPTQLALYVRRCHDTNRRGWWYFVPFGNVVVTFLASDLFENRFGNPN